MPAKRNQSHDCPIRDVLDRVGDAWSVLVIKELSEAPCRFNALQRVIDPISPRMLAATLKHLERDGLVTRHVMDQSPPQVEYRLTRLGYSLHHALDSLSDWANANQQRVRAARQTYDSMR